MFCESCKSNYGRRCMFFFPLIPASCFVMLLLHILNAICEQKLNVSGLWGGKKLPQTYFMLNVGPHVCVLVNFRIFSCWSGVPFRASDIKRWWILLSPLLCILISTTLAVILISFWIFHATILRFHYRASIWWCWKWW